MELRHITPEPVIIDDQKLSSTRPQGRDFLRKILSQLIKIQKYSAYSFLSFTSLHFSSVIIFPGLNIPIDYCQEAFELARSVYQLGIYEKFLLGSGLIHVLSGVGIRLLKYKLGIFKVKKPKDELIKLRDESRRDIGLGGITSLIGLGYRKSIISQFTNLTPTTFSGYCLIPLISYHVFKFKIIPTLIDGDSSLINLNYISFYLTQTMVKFGNFINFSLILVLIWSSFYHFTSGYLSLTKRFKKIHKRFGYGIITTGTMLGLLSLLRFKSMKLDDGFMGKQFMNYINYIKL